MSYRTSELARRRRRWSVMVASLLSHGIPDNADESGRTPNSRGNDLGRRCSTWSRDVFLFLLCSFRSIVSFADADQLYFVSLYDEVIILEFCIPTVTGFTSSHLRGILTSHKTTINPSKKEIIVSLGRHLNQTHRTFAAV